MSEPATNDSLPSAGDAEALAFTATGSHPTTATRFATGSQHFVFDVCFADRAPIVVRISRSADRALARGAAQLSHVLRPLGVPLPAIIAESLDARFPYLILERLPGTDLGHVIGKLPAESLESILVQIVGAQRIVASTPSGRRYGYASEPANAPHARWSHVLDASLARSRSRIAAAGIFDLKLADALEAVLAGLRDQADAIPATPFLHDTTTKNVIVTEDGAFSGIVDVDDLCFGDPRYVVALTHAAITAFGGPLAYTGIWMGLLAGFADDGLFRLYVALCLLDFLSEEGQVFNGNQRPTSPEKRQALLDLYQSALQRLS